MNAPALFTAAQFAAALQRSKRGVWKALKHVRPAAEEMVRGQSAAVWSITQLPESLRSELTAKATAGGYRDAAAMIFAPPKTWEPPVPPG